MKKGIKREFSVARTPQQNGVAKRRNMTLIEAARTMLADSKLPTTFWAEAVNTSCYVENKVIIVKPHNKTPYELFRGRTPALSFMRPFGCHVTILNTLDHLGKFDGKPDDGFFVGYSLTRDGPKWLFDIDSLTKLMNYVPVVACTNSNNFAGSEESNGAGHTSKETEFSQDYIVMPLWKDGSMFDSSSKNSSDDEPQPSSNAEKKDDEGVSKVSGFSDQEQPKSSTPNINTAGLSINTASANFKTGSLNTNIISPTVITTSSLVQIDAEDQGMFENEIDTQVSAHGEAHSQGSQHEDQLGVFSAAKILADIVTRNKARLVAQGYTQEEGIDYDKMYVRSAFLYGTIEEDVYVCQPPRFEDLEYPDKVYKMSSMGELNFFLGLQVKQREDGIFISRDKYVAEILRKFGFTDVRTASTPMDTEKPLLKDSDGDDVDVYLYRSMIGSLMYLTSSRPDIMFADSLKGQQTLGLWYPRNSPFDLVAYSDSDYARASLDRKSTTGEQFWQTATASTLEDGDMGITATINGKVKVVYEASIRRHLKLEDSDGISTLSTVEIFEQLALIDYVSNSNSLTFQKGHFSPQWKFLIHTILHCLSSKKTAWE
ncbi:ribonuclease H-like domain-containing protein [Tanacetum coccineum]